MELVLEGAGDGKKNKKKEELIPSVLPAFPQACPVCQQGMTLAMEQGGQEPPEQLLGARPPQLSPDLTMA